MRNFGSALSGAEIQAICGGEYRGDESLQITGVAEPAEARSSDAVFWEQERLFDSVLGSQAGLIICPPRKSHMLPGRNLLQHPRPTFAMMKLVSWWLESTSEKPRPGIHPSAVVDPSAMIAADAHIGAFCVIGANCSIENGVAIETHCSLGAGSRIGKGSRLYPRVTLYPGCVIGEQCVIHSGVVLGADGFGFILENGAQHKIPQVGNVVIGNWVEIGANSTVDRGTLGPTSVGDGTKIDNQVQIGHNCRIGKHCILCAQVGLAGSTLMGDYVYMAGKSGSAGHLSIGDRAMVGAQGGVTHDLPADGKYWGTPAIDAGFYKRLLAIQRKLPQIYCQYRKHAKNEGDER